MDRRKNPVSEMMVARAKQMRREPTYPEHRLWQRLRGSQIAGLHFRRQHPVGPYILDFYCAATKLVIELDGVSHDERAAYDEQRTRFLESNGLRVIRFCDDDVLGHLDEVLHIIACEYGLEV